MPRLGALCSSVMGGQLCVTADSNGYPVSACCFIRMIMNILQTRTFEFVTLQ